ncbi:MULTISPECIES: efflux RND transporter periplasmic adaptor subunit [unclassified Mucilaginibacter]|uniref:efflux RND transporter periplasmic adaptor subunit n=1 Tax=unclassified Mucilaginibacter TaxID=2617802 RepID=UPI002AC913AF|nr:MULTISPECIES: efflux RND transporter periplasmic adaptor subunit [unclassified Mucilaginibacter]MEB0260265.1 efflux RND transporter periplasmic adaptor subunit [Mucilaginibacter sp. 10I4]MEB0277324.1 efflux RND transporter periplasmic adaptor subunit [Mucilaginibacter sp. 10B2]MEB0303150.1 efflux RND transporter periplasmic adaptor subunit [Mucilaginibacter sp. 5C4]WPX25450.1 efflux RND transporter periplasmic adaptor subunit [Mucilaginibacter sp. 5C4]
MKIILAAIIAISIFSCGPKQQAPQAPPPPALPVAAVTTGNQTTYQEYPASIEGTVNVEVRPQVSGSLDKVFIDEGAFVNAGQPIFKINEQPYRAALNNALASLHAAEAAQGNAQIEVDKLTPLVANKVVSYYQLKTAKVTFQVAKANIESAKANVATAQINLGYTLIKAPVSGYIGRLLKKQGSLVTPQDVEALTQLSDVHEVHVYFALGEKDFVSFKEQYAGNTIGDKLKHLPSVALLLADGSEYAKAGKIDVINGQFDKTTGAITVRATFANPQGLLRSGNTGKIRLSLPHPNTLIIPQSATIEMQDKIFVFALADSNKVKKLPITIEGTSGENYLVKDGVKAGDQIVLSGIDKLQEGMVIAPQKSVDKAAAVAKN